MAYKPETEPPQLQLSSFPNLKSTQHYSGALTPLHSSASVPFSWEQEPGKPLPCLTLAFPSHDNLIKSLDLPPRLLNEAKFTKTPSPTTVLEGPYNSIGRSILGSSSFRFIRKRQKSFDGSVSFTGSRGSSPERSLVSNTVDRGLFGSWRKKGGINSEGKSETYEGNFVISNLSDDGIGSGYEVAPETVGKVRRKKRQMGLSKAKSHFWATIYGTFRQVIPRRRTK